jgi:hypothetical protein
MCRLRLKAFVASGLSLWLGALACLLGCAQPGLASARAIHHSQSSQCRAAETASDDGDCCHQGKNDPKRKDQAPKNPSCCPLDATIGQKQDAAPVLPVQPAIFEVTTLQPFQFQSESTLVQPLALHAGRDLLHQIHILRI